MTFDPVTVLIADENFTVVTNPVTTYTSLTMELKFNEVGSGELLAPADDWLLEAVTTPGHHVMVVRNGEVFGAGPIEKPGAVEWATDGGVGNVRVNFATHDVWLAHRLTYPDPTLVATSTSQPTAYTATATNAEVVMRDLVNRNAGTGALAARQVPNLGLGALATVGSNVTISTRFEPLSDVLRAIARAGGGLGFRVAQVGTALEFVVYDPVDRSDEVRFSRQLGNLRSLSTDPEAPTATVAIVGGDGTGDAREIVEREDGGGVTAWGRREVWVNQGGAEGGTAELEQAGDLALLDGAEQINITAEAVDTLWARYGVDYNLGDLVGVEVTPGAAVAELVSGVTLTATPDGGAVIAPKIGSTDRIGSGVVWAVRDLTRRLGRVERG